MCSREISLISFAKTSSMTVSNLFFSMIFGTSILVSSRPIEYSTLTPFFMFLTLICPRIAASSKLYISFSVSLSVYLIMIWDMSFFLVESEGAPVLEVNFAPT